MKLIQKHSVGEYSRFEEKIGRRPSPSLPARNILQRNEINRKTFLYVIFGSIILRRNEINPKTFCGGIFAIRRKDWSTSESVRSQPGTFSSGMKLIEKHSCTRYSTQLFSVRMKLIQKHSVGEYSRFEEKIGRRPSPFAPARNILQRNEINRKTFLYAIFDSIILRRNEINPKTFCGGIFAIRRKDWSNVRIRIEWKPEP